MCRAYVHVCSSDEFDVCVSLSVGPVWMCVISVRNLRCASSLHAVLLSVSVGLVSMCGRVLSSSAVAVRVQLVCTRAWQCRACACECLTEAVVQSLRGC